MASVLTGFVVENSDPTACEFSVLGVGGSLTGQSRFLGGKELDQVRFHPVRALVEPESGPSDLISGLS